VKNPNAPLPRAKYALIWFSHCRTASLFAASNRSLQSQYGLAVTRSQNTRSLATRASGRCRRIIILRAIDFCLVS
jgi:hypothetical protein